MNRHRRGIFDGLPIPADKSYLKEGLSRIDEGWAAARFDSLPHVVHILTSKDRDGEIQFLKEQSDLIEDVVDEVVHAYHHGFNKAIQNYSQILRLFSESAESIAGLKGEMAEAKALLGRKNQHLGQLWYRSLTLRHVISLLDQVEDVAKVPARIENLMAEKQLYAAVQLHVQSMLMLEREGLQAVGALQEVRSDLTKLRGALFYKILEDLHCHLYNSGEYSLMTLSMVDNEEVPTSTATGRLVNNMQPLSRRSRSIKGENHFGGPAAADGISKISSVDGGSSFDGPDDDSSLDMRESDGGRGRKDSTSISRKIPSFLSCATPDEFLESMIKTDAPLNVKYLRTLVQCLSMLQKVAAAGAVICQRVRPTIHDVITSKIKSYTGEASKSNIDKIGRETSDVSHSHGPGTLYQLSKQKTKNGALAVATQLVCSPISPAMAPTGDAQQAASKLLGSIFECLVDILENHITVGELLEQKSSTEVENVNTPHVANGDTSWNPDSEYSQATGGFSVAFSLSVVQSECQQLLCEILRATPEAATADAAVQTARLANKDPVKEKRDGSEGLSFAFRITDAAISAQNEGQGWRRSSTVPQEGYGTASVIPDQGIFLAASVYRPVFEFMNNIGLVLPPKYSQLGNDGLLAFVNNFLKEHFLPAIFVDYRKCVQQAISSPAAFRPRVNATSVYSSVVENGRPVLQGLLAVDIIAKEVLGWVRLMPNYATELVEYVRTFLERTHERCRASYMEAVLEKQSYILLSRSDVESLMRLDPANASLQNSFGQLENYIPEAEGVEVEIELSDLLLDMGLIKQENLIHDDQKLILLASLSDSLEYLADSVERLGESFISPSTTVDNKSHMHQGCHTRSTSAIPKNLASLADEYRRLAVDCVRVLRLEMQLETIYHMQEMTKREYVEDQDAEDPDDFIISLTTQIARRDEEMAPYVAEPKRNYVFGGISSVAANASIKALAQMKSINLLGVQQICRNSIALEQALAAMPSIDSEAVQQRLDRVRTFYELLNLPFESLLGFIGEQEYLFSAKDSSFDGPDDDSSLDMRESDGGRGRKDSTSISRKIPSFLSCATPDEFLESMIKTDAPLNVKYLRTLVQCLSMLQKVAAAGAVICQRVRPTIHDVITSKIKSYTGEASKSNIDKIGRETSDVSHSHGPGTLYQLSKQKTKNGALAVATQLVCSPISPAMAPTGDAQQAASKLLGSIFECLVDILENHITVGELLEQKSSTEVENVNTPHVANGDTSWNPDSEYSQATGGFSVAFSLSVVQSECQQLLCEILRATPEAATADAAVQTARLANKDPVKEKRDGSEGLSFAFRITDAAISAQNEGQGWRRSSTVPQEGYGTASVIPDQGIFLAASVYRPVFEFMNNIGLVLPPKYSQLGNDGLLAFVNNFLKEHFLPAIFVDYRKCVQQAISSPAAFRPRVNATSVYSSVVENGRPVLQGLLAVDIIAKEVLGWVRLMPNYATELVEYVRTFLERTHERCRASYMEAVLEKQSYILLSRSDVESLMRLDPANASLQNSFGQLENYIPEAEGVEVEIELSDLLLDMGLIKQENLIHDDQKLILLASLSDSLEYLADSVERLGESFISPSTTVDNKSHMHQGCHTRSTSAIPKNLASLADEYRRLAVDCVRVLRLEMQLETIYHMQEMTKREYVEDQDAEDPDDFIISLTTQIARRDEEMAPYVAEPKRNYVFGGISSVAANASIKALAQMKSINLLGVQQICRNSIALEQALAAMPSIDSEAVQQRLDRVRTFYELLNLPFESLLGFIGEQEYLFSAKEYLSVLKVNVPGRDIPMDAERRISQILGH